MFKNCERAQAFNYVCTYVCGCVYVCVCVFIFVCVYVCVRALSLNLLELFCRILQWDLLSSNSKYLF